ncbi:MAG: hypothetical protein REI09_03825 [Candidatus Dactylopiibacterium sp.]|nr:hypothetical protein [Candidatus Dactylopiibacterium sp.]
MPLRRHYIHFLAADGLRTHERARGQIRARARHAATPSGVGDFEAWLSARPHAVHHLVVDLVDEHASVEALPPLRARERRAWITRRAARQFPASTCATGMRRGKDDALLLSGLPSALGLSPWLDVFDRQDAALATVHTSAGLLATSLSRQGDAGLCIALTPAGLRFVQFDAAGLRFTRLAPLPEDEFDALFLLQETRKTLHHLADGAAPGTPAPGTPLPLHVLLPAALLPEAQAALAQTGAGPVLVMPAAPPPRGRNGLAATDLHAEVLATLALLVLSGTPAPQLAPAPARATHRVRTWRDAGVALALVASAGLCAWSAHVHEREVRLEAETLALQRTAQDTARRIADHLSPLPSAAALAQLRALAPHLARLATPLPPPETLLLPLSRVLEHYPGMVLEALEWRYDSPGPAGSPLRLALEMRLEGDQEPVAALRSMREFCAGLQALGLAVNVTSSLFAGAAERPLLASELADPRSRRFALSLTRAPQSPPP